MKSDIILSIIVPYFNVEKYIEVCIRSLFNQDIPYSDYEVICVNDCSEDNSEAIVSRLKAEFPNLLMVSQTQNHKMGAARNLGLSNARGKYVWFVDSDDYIEPDCISYIIRKAEESDVDIIHFDYKVDNDGIISTYRTSYDDEKIYSGNDFFVSCEYEQWWQRCVEVWRRIHKKSFLLDNAILFEEDVMYEDTDYSIKCYGIAKAVQHLNISPYIYRRNNNSVTRRKRTPEIINWRVLQLCRCWGNCPLLHRPEAELQIKAFIQAEAGVIRKEVQILSLREKMKFLSLIDSTGYTAIKGLVSKKTWLAIRYGFPVDALKRI